MLPRFISLFKGEFLDHTVDLLQFRELDGVFAIVLVPRRPGDDRTTVRDHGDGVYRGLTSN